MTMDQEYIPGDSTKATSIRQQVLETLKGRGIVAGVIPMSLASRIDRKAYPGKKLELDGIELWVKA